MRKLIAKKVTALEKVLPGREPSDEGVRGRISGLKGETVSFQAAYYAETEAFEIGAAEVLSPIQDCVKLRMVHLVPCNYPCGPVRDGDYITTEPGMYPDRLSEIPEWGLPLVNGQWRSLWVDVEIPENMEAGIYPVKVVFRRQGEIAASVETEIQVIDAVIPAMTTPHTEWFHSDCLANYYGVEVFSEDYWRIVENFVRTAVKRRCTMLLTPIFTPPLDTAVGGERRTVQLVDVTVESDGNVQSLSFGT